MALVLLPYMYIPDPTRGRPIFNGKIYIGEPDTDPKIVSNQKSANLVQEDGTTVPASYPILTNSGGVPIYNGSPVAIDVNGAFSIAIDDRNDDPVYYFPLNGTESNFVVSDLRSIMFDLGLGYSDIGTIIVTSESGVGLDDAEYLLDLSSGQVWLLPSNIPPSSTVSSVSGSTLTTNNGQFEMKKKQDDIFASGSVILSGGVPSITSSKNILGISDNGIGNYTLTFDKAPPSTNYSVVVTNEEGTAGQPVKDSGWSDKQLSNFDVIIRQSSTALIDSSFDFIVTYNGGL